MTEGNGNGFTIKDLVLLLRADVQRLDDKLTAKLDSIVARVETLETDRARNARPLEMFALFVNGCIAALAAAVVAGVMVR